MHHMISAPLSSLFYAASCELLFIYLVHLEAIMRYYPVFEPFQSVDCTLKAHLLGLQ